MESRGVLSLRFKLTDQTVKNNLNNQLMHTLKKIIDEKRDIDLSLDRLLLLSRINKRRFLSCYQNQADLIQSLNNTFVNQLKEVIPYVKTKKDLVIWTDNLIEISKSAKFLKEAKTIFILNQKLKLNLFRSLQQQIINILDIRMHIFFKQLKKRTTVLDEEECKKSFYSVMEDAIVKDEPERFQLLIYSLGSLKVVFE